MTQKRRGRPPAKDSGDTRRAIIDAGRRHFARVGFQGSSLTGIAKENNLSATAIYHYFADKESLYDSVARETIELVWNGLLDRVSKADRLEDQIEEFLSGAEQIGADERLFSGFLIGVPVEAQRNDGFTELMDLLADWQSKVFEQMADTGLHTGELPGFRDREAASLALRMLLLGWSWETHYQPEYRSTWAEVVRVTVATWRFNSAPV